MSAAEVALDHRVGTVGARWRRPRRRPASARTWRPRRGRPGTRAAAASRASRRRRAPRSAGGTRRRGSCPPAGSPRSCRRSRRRPAPATWWVPAPRRYPGGRRTATKPAVSPTTPPPSATIASPRSSPHAASCEHSSSTVASVLRVFAVADQEHVGLGAGGVERGGERGRVPVGDTGLADHRDLAPPPDRVRDLGERAGTDDHVVGRAGDARRLRVPRVAAPRSPRPRPRRRCGRRCRPSRRRLPRTRARARRRGASSVADRSPPARSGRESSPASTGHEDGRRRLEPHDEAGASQHAGGCRGRAPRRHRTRSRAAPATPRRRQPRRARRARKPGSPSGAQSSANGMPAVATTSSSVSTKSRPSSSAQRLPTVVFPTPIRPTSTRCGPRERRHVSAETRCTPRSCA